MSIAPATQISMFDELPAELPETSVPARVFDAPNKRHGHLLIESSIGDWLFLNLGDKRVRLGQKGSDCYVELDSEQLGAIGEYCLMMAERLGVT